jgi:hypothetical protein
MPFINSARGQYGAQGMRAMKGPLAPVGIIWKIDRIFHKDRLTLFN